MEPMMDKEKKVIFQGAGTALITPFKGEEVDYGALEGLLDWQLASGIDAIVALGTTGEPSTMTDREREEVLTYVIARVNKRVPVIAGTGGNNTAKVIADSKRAKELGADALLIVTPYYNKTTQHGLVAHYRAIADSVDCPIIVYNVPPRTGLNMLPATLSELADHPNIVGMKEASGNISQITEMFRLCHDRIAIYSGDDDCIVPFLALGGEGVVSVLSNIAPADVHELAASWARGDQVKPVELQLRYTPLIRQLFVEVSPTPVKTALGMMGKCADTVRMPLVPMLDEHKGSLAEEMKKVGLIQ